MITGKASKIDLIKSFGTLSMGKIIESDYPPLCVLKNKITGSKTEKILAVIVSDACASHNRQLTGFCIKEIAVRLLSTQLSSLSLEDVYVSLNDFIAENIYGELSVAKIIHHLTKYQNLKQTLVAEYNYNRHLATKFIDHNRLDKEKKQAEKLSYIKSRLLINNLKKK